MLRKCLLIIDPQNDFLEGGNLAVNEAKEVMEDLARYINKYGNEYQAVIMSCDFHPINHCSFKENGGEWPMHCVQHSFGAAIFAPIMNEVIALNKPILILPKGQNAEQEEYSAFINEGNVKSFNQMLSDLDIEQIDICGVAGDFCILRSMESLIKLGYKKNIFALTDFIPSIDDGTTLHNFMKENDIMHSLT